MDPARIAQKTLLVFGSDACEPRAMAVIHTKAHACENAVRTNALARRHPYPPAKSEAPQTNTAETEHATGANCDSWDTNDEGNTRNQSHRCMDSPP